MAKFSGQITLAEVQKGEKGAGIVNIVSWYQIFPVGITPTLATIKKDTFKYQNAEEINNPSFNWVTTPKLPSAITEYLWSLQEIIFDNNSESQLTEPVICGNAVTAIMSQYSVDGSPEGIWEEEYQAGRHQYIRFSYDGGNTWATPIKIVGLDGASTVTTVYSIVPDCGEVLKFLATEEEKKEDSEKIYVFAPERVYFSLKKSSATSDTIEPIYIPSDFRGNPIPSEEIDKEKRETLYSHLTIKYLSKLNQNSIKEEPNHWVGIDVESYKEAFYDYVNGEDSEPRLMLDLKELWKLVNKPQTGAGIDRLIEIFSEETLIKFELGYWDLITVEQPDGTLAYEERKQTFSTFITLRFAMTKDLAELSVNAHDIYMSIANAGLKFDGSGLHLQNGNFEIIRINEDGKQEQSFWADNQGNVTLKGRVEAESGSFKGDVYANNGVFKGSIYASRGELGSLNITDSLHIENIGNIGNLGIGIDIGRYSYSEITEPINEELIKKNNWYIFSEADNTFIKYDGIGYDSNSTIVYSRKDIGGIKSTNYSQELGKGFFISADGQIHANELFIGSNAEIESSLKIGDNCYISKPTQEVPNFIKIVDDNDRALFKLDSTGKMTLGTIVFDGTSSSIFSNEIVSSTYGWSLTPQQAIFNNIVARGSIEASVFKYGEVTAVGGIILARPASKVKEIAIDKDGKVVYEENKGVEITLEEGNGFTEAAGEENKGYCLFTSRNGLAKVYLKITEIVTQPEDNGLYNFKDFKIKVIAEENNSISWKAEDYTNLLNETLIYIGRTAQYDRKEDENGNIISEELLREGSVGICINGSDDSSSFTVPRAITVYTLGENYDQRHNKIILGLIPNEPGFGRIAGTYGLYGENVYLKGALVTEASSDNPVFSGISTTYTNDDDIPTLEGFKEQFPNAKGLGKILLWAGAPSNNKVGIEAAKFKVDEYGNMYAGSGYFNGSILTNATIEAAKIRTAIIEGTGIDKEQEYGLTIHDVEKGIQFTQTKRDDFNNIIYSEDGKTPLVNTIFSLTKDGILANVKFTVKDLEITGESPLNFKKLSFNKNQSGLGMKSNYLSFWNNQFSKAGYLRMETDGLGFYYGQANLENSDDWEELTDKDFSKVISLGNNISIGNQQMNKPPELILWGGITMGETAQIVQVDGGFDINIL